MSFFVILLVYYLYRSANAWHNWQIQGWDTRWWEMATNKNLKLGRFFYVLLPIIGLFLLEYNLHSLPPLGQFIMLGIDVFVLIQVLGREPLEAHFERYRELLRDGKELEAGTLAAKELRYETPSDSQASIKLVWQALARRAFVDFFAILFWYWLGGVAAALAWRLVFIGGCYDPTMNRLRHALGWLPARFAVLGYALVGHFGNVLPILTESLADAHMRASRLLCISAKAAIQSDCEDDTCAEKPFERLYELVCRTELVWLAAFSLLVLAGFNGFQ